MKEEFLYYLWENRLTKGTLRTTTGQTVCVISPGYRNLNSGPDFLEAKIEIDDQLWAGHVEIHVRSSDWNRHGHQYDKAYRNVVLHVVFDDDQPVNDIPVLELRGHFDESLYYTYERFLGSRRWIACERHLRQVQPFTILSTLDRMAIERLEMKADAVGKQLIASKYDWEGTFYQLLLRYFGLKVNSEASEYLAYLLPLKTLLKHADNLLQVEAMLFGCAGFLEHDFTEDYPKLLQREFAVMKSKFGLLSMPEERWKFMRMRPVNFPTLRLAQIAQLIHRNKGMFSIIREAETLDQARAAFNVTASSYWDTHYRFSTDGNGTATATAKHLGHDTIDVLMINAVIPLLFCYGKTHKDEHYCEKALKFLEAIAAENNTVVRDFANCGINASNAMESQAMLQLYQHYCKRKRCLECPIGNVLLR